MARVLLDASILLSATVSRPESPPSLLLGAARAGTFEIAICERLLGEVEAGLSSRYFRPRVTPDEGSAFLAMLKTIGVMHEDPIDPPRVLRDRSDDYLVALARVAHVDAIITGDRDLLDHEGLQPPAVAARQACADLGLVDR